MRAMLIVLCCATFMAAALRPADLHAQFLPPFFQQAPQPQASPTPAPQPSAPARREPSQPKPKAAAPKKAPAKAEAGPVPYPEVRSACASEIKGTCAGVTPGGAESVLCLRRNFSVHAPECQAALTRAGVPNTPPAAAAPGPAEGPRGTADAPRRVSTDRVAPAPTAERPAAEIKLPTMRQTQEARFVNRYCREDHGLLCQGVNFGQSRVLKCLAAQQGSLSEGCRKALIARGR